MSPLYQSNDMVIITTAVLQVQLRHSHHDNPSLCLNRDIHLHLLLHIITWQPKNIGSCVNHRWKDPLLCYCIDWDFIKLNFSYPYLHSWSLFNNYTTNTNNNNNNNNNTTWLFLTLLLPWKIGQKRLRKAGKQTYKGIK